MLRGVFIIAGTAFAVATYAPDLLNNYLDRSPGKSAPVAMNISAPRMQDYGGRIQLSENRYGHYISDIEVNGRRVSAMVDTGASFVVIRYEDARNLGLIYGGDRFETPVQTANGTGHVRRVKLSNIRLGSISLDNVDALIAEEGMLPTNLLGMSFLKRLSRYEVRDNTLVLER